MLDKNNLSKIKYLYRIYESSDNIMHLEKHPIIYINSHVVYYKVGNNEALNKRKLTCINEKIKNFYAYNNYYYNRPVHCYEEYYYVESKEIKEIFEILKEQQKEYRANVEQKELESRYKKAEQEYLYAKVKYEDLKKEYESRNSKR